MLDSNLTKELVDELLFLVPDALDDPTEFWRVVPDTLENFTYSVSSKRDILIRHTSCGKGGRKLRPKLVTMSWDEGTWNTSIRRSRKGLSTYIEHVRYDAFPELNEVKTLEDDIKDAIDVPYDGLDWYGRKKTIVHILPVSESDMTQVRLFYPEDLPREMWAYVPDTNRKYVVSSQSRGVILKRYRVDGSILKPQIWQLKSGKIEDSPYYECCLTVGDRQLNSVSHPHILKSFVTRPSDEYEVNHIDGNQRNNVLDNLEWVTRQQNSDHYNKSPEMKSKREIGYKKVSEWGKLHQKEVQNRPEVNAKRGVSVKKSWTPERKARQSAISKNLWTPERKARQSQMNRERWNTLTPKQKQLVILPFMQHNEALHQAKINGVNVNENKEDNSNSL